MDIGYQIHGWIFTEMMDFLKKTKQKTKPYIEAKNKTKLYASKQGNGNDNNNNQKINIIYIQIGILCSQNAAYVQV